MATKTPIPPGPPPRGFQWPDQPPQGSITPLGSGPTGAKTVVVQPGRHGITVFVGIVTLVVGLIIGYQLGRGDDSTEDASASTDTTTAPATVTTAPPTTPTTAGGEGGASVEPLGTISNPVPAGQTWILGIWQLEILGTDFDAADTVTAASNQNPIPDDGSVYVLVDIELTAVDDLFVTAADFAPGLARPDGTEVPVRFQACGPEVPDDFFANGRLRQDEPVRGNLCFEVPADATDGLVLTTDGVGDTVTYFALDES